MSRVIRVRLSAALIAALALALVAGCGGEDGAGSAAELVPANLALYAVVDTDFDGGQWSDVDELAARFPGGENFRQRVLEELEAGDVDFEEDVDPALGPEVVFVVLEFAADSDEEPPLVVLTQPDDQAALERLLEEGDEPAVNREVDGWQVVAEDDATIDRFLSAREGSRLADSEQFQDAMDGLEEDALVRLFVDGETIQGASADADAAQALDAFAPGGEAPSLGAVVQAEEDGARVEGQLVYAEDLEGGPLSVEPYEAELPGEVPGDVLAYVSFNDLEQAISAYRDALSESDPELESQLGMAEGFLGVSLEEDIAPLFAEEGAVYVRRGALIPEVTLVTQVEDEEQALATLDDLTGRIGNFLPFGQPERNDVDGVEVRRVPLSGPVSLGYAAFDGLLVVTTDTEGIADLRADEDRLADADAFEEALDRAGMPGETSGFAYVDLEETLPLLFGFAEVGLGGTSEARRYTEPLQSVVVWGEQEGSTQSFSLFVGVE